MKISGFTIIKNAIINDYPILEAITSILPVVDEMIVSVGDCEDETRQLIESIPSDKIKIFDSVWDPSLREGGRVLAVETDKALAHVATDSDWAFYIQADEVVHEKYHDAIKVAAEKYVDDKNIEGLLFRYTHFYGSYDYVGDSRKWYDKEIRIIRNDKNIKAYRDAQGFRKEGKKLHVKLIDAFVYHYGWVKNPNTMREKIKNSGRFWNEDDTKVLMQAEMFDFSNFDSLVKFSDTHPAVMKKRIAEQSWHIDLDLSKKKMNVEKKVLYWFEKATGIRLFDYKNYKIIK
jgi:hypothetical protein